MPLIALNPWVIERTKVHWDTGGVPSFHGGDPLRGPSWPAKYTDYATVALPRCSTFDQCGAYAISLREVAADIREAWDSELDKDQDVVAAFEAAKESQFFVEGRIAALESLLARATIIDEAAARASDTVQLGSVVVLVNGDNVEHTYQIVGTAESNPATGKLSYESPVGSAVQDRRAGDRIEVRTPSGNTQMLIKALR